MNLHGIVGPIIGAVNPFIPAVLMKSTGFVVTPDYSRIPTYRECQVTAQVQALSGKDFRQVEGLNLNGTVRSIYLYGSATATERVSSKGGDLIAFMDRGRARLWLVNQVMEQWPDWCKVVSTLQDDTMNSAFQAFGENQDTTALITLSSQGAGTIQSADQTNPGFKGLILGVNLSTATGASVLVSILGKDAASGKYYTAFSGLPLTATGLTTLTMYPGVLSTGGSYPQPLPATWAISAVISGGSAVVSGTIGASLLQ